jgi:hypothetical protein
MKLKLDENLGERGAILFRSGGHDVATVAGQGMSSASDDDLIATCKVEGRCLVTLDLDFGNPVLFPPWQYRGIAVLRLPRKPTDEDLWSCCRTLMDGLTKRDITGRLWVVQRDRIREYEPVEDQDD